MDLQANMLWSNRSFLACGYVNKITYTTCLTNIENVALKNYTKALINTALYKKSINETKNSICICR